LVVSSYAGGFDGVNDGGNAFPFTQPAQGLEHITRYASNFFEYYIDSVLQYTNNRNSTGLPIGTFGTNYSGSVAKTYCLGLGSSMFGKQAALYNAWTTYKTSL
jgi:hypothetical protein